ncbi:MAG: kelch repeat-containing protein [Anaerolineae bacterium]
MAREDCPLSERELEVLRLVATGATNQQIARELVISPNTVKVHLRNIFEKLGVSSRTEATMLAVQEGWIILGDARVEAPAQETGAIAERPRREIPPLQRWQQLYLVAVIALAVVALVWSPNTAAREGRGISILTDRGQPVLGPPTWEESPRWQAMAPLPVPLSRLAVAVVDEALYAIGGESAEGVQGSVLAYDPQGNTWRELAGKPTPARNLAAVAWGGKIYAIGGCDASHAPTAAVEVYDPIADTWRSAEAMPMPRCAHAAAILGDSLYVFGGWDGQDMVSDVFKYDFTSGVWEQLDPMPEAAGFAAAVAVNDAIYLLGGHDGNRELGTFWRFTVADGKAQWERLPSMALPRGGLAAASDGIGIYAIGGGWSGRLAFNERFDLVSRTWSRIPSPIQLQWRNLGAAYLKQRVYAVGGWSGDYLTTVAAYQASFRAFLPLGAAGE